MEEKLKGVYINELDTFLKLPRKVQEIMWLDLRGKEIKPELFDVAFNFEIYQECESPIEIIFAYYLDKYMLEKGLSVDQLYIYPQENITTDNGKNYRVDFFIEFYQLKNTESDFWNEYSSSVIIECDGHQFHEKTKAQVKKRNERDYDLKMSGYDVIHFSGSEIFNNPEECIEKMIDFLNKNLKLTQ